MELDFKTISHFRDIGGEMTKDGRAIKHNLIFRSGELTHVSKQEQGKLHNLNIKTVYDLRSEKEQVSNPDVKGSYDIVSCPLAKPSFKTDVKYQNPINFMDRVKNANESYYNYSKLNFAKDYLEFAYNIEAISKIIESLDRHEVFLYHCFGGKDRTGVISMLIMLFLGCDYETCKAHYMYHSVITVEEEKAYIEMLKKNNFNEAGIKISQYFFEVSEELFDCAWYSIFDVYNTIEDYLYDLFNVDMSRINNWREFYLENI